MGCTIMLTNKETISNKIREKVVKNHISYIDSILDYCYSTEIEVETIIRFLDSDIIDHLKHEGTSMNLLKKTPDMLPV